MNEKPKYIIKVTRDWRYGKRARFWDIQKWYQMGKNPEDGYWGSACRGGLAYSEWGMWRAINKKLKKMDFGYYENYFTLDKEPYEYPNCSDANTDKCSNNDPNCRWRSYTCVWCEEDYKISKRGLTGKHMIADHNKTCKAFKKANK